MNRVSVDIGGTFTDCFVVWGNEYVEAKALTTHQNLAMGFNSALVNACSQLGVDESLLLSKVDSVRYATTLGTNALIQRKGPRVALITTSGYRASVPLCRAKGYGTGLSHKEKMDVPNARRPEPLVPIPMIFEARERIDHAGNVVLRLDEDDLRQKIRLMVDKGAETVVVVLANSVVNPVHETRIQEIFRDEYPGHLLGAVPIILSHQVVGRKGEYVRAMSTIMDGFLHSVMYHGLGSLELSLRASGYHKPMLCNHNSGGMAQLNSTDALQTVHSGPVSGIAASEHLTGESKLGNIVATDMGGTSFDIGIVTEGGGKHYDFNPEIERWMVSTPMIHLVTLGAGGGSIASYDRIYRTVAVGPQSAGSDPGPACYDRGGTLPTVTDADLLLGYLDPENYAGGRIGLNPRRSRMAVEDELCENLDVDVVEAAKLIKQTVDSNMANGTALELRTRGYDPQDFTLMAYGGNGPLHACGIATALGVKKVLAPPFASVFSAVGAGTMSQMHINEKSAWMVLFDSANQRFTTDYARFNEIVAELEERGQNDLIRQGFDAGAIEHRLELDMRYGNQRVETGVDVDSRRVSCQHDILQILSKFHTRYGETFGEGSQAVEAGVRINTFRVVSFVQDEGIPFGDVRPCEGRETQPDPVGSRHCHFVGHDGPVETKIYDTAAVGSDAVILGPAIMVSPSTTYLVEPGWRFEYSASGAGWFTRNSR